MIKTTIFDVLVVYSDRLAESASSVSSNVSMPFSEGSRRESYNMVYGYFLDMCKANNLKAALTTSADITGAGECRSYWLFRNGAWVKSRKIGYSKVIFDKFSPINKRIKASRKLLFSSKKVKSFNDPYLFDLFFDKQKTYEKFRKFSIPTVAIKESTPEGVGSVLRALEKLVGQHPSKKDFSSEIVMKDRFGAGGLKVYKFKAGQTVEMVKQLKKHNKKSFIVQPFVKFDKGFSYQNLQVSTDIRLIYSQGKIVQSYIRMAKGGDFRCNEHLGGTLKYIAKSEVPKDLVLFSERIVNEVNKRSSLFALDFIISNHKNMYLVEGNTGPGLDWDLSSLKNEIESKKLIRIVVRELYKLVRPGEGLLRD